MSEEYDLKTSFAKHGFIVPIIKDANGNIIDGIHRHQIDPNCASVTSHLRALEKHGIIEVNKGFKGRKPHSTIILTEKGRSEFEKLLNWFYDTFLEGLA